MTDKTESSLQLDETEILLLKEKEEKNILKETLSQKDETIENLKRCLQLYQSGLKEPPVNVEAGHNPTVCVEQTDNLKESFTNNHGILTAGQSEVRLDDIIIDDDVDDLVNFVNKELLGQEHFLKELDISFDVDSEIVKLENNIDVDSEIVKLENNIDINDLATFSGFSFGGLSEEYSNDEVVSEIMSSPLDVKESGNNNSETFDRNSLDSSVQENKTAAIRKSKTGKSMKKMIPREFLTETVEDEEVMTVEDEEIMTVEDDILDILNSSSGMYGVPPLEKMAPKVPIKGTSKGRIKRESDICVTGSANKWLVDNKQSSRKRNNLSLKSGKKYNPPGSRKLKKGRQSVQSNTDGKDTAGKALYRIVDCSKCGVNFPMDRKQILNSFFKPGSPRCPHCQTSPKEKGKNSNFNFMSKTILEKGQTSEKMENGKINRLSVPSLHLTERKVTRNKSNIQCEVCGKQFPMGGEWKYKKHMDVHIKGKRQAAANVDVKIHPVEITKERKKPVQVKREENVIEMKDQMEDKSHIKGKQEANVCDVCQESFKYKSTLLAHMKTHKSNYPFFCKLCHKFFKQIDDMVNHGVLDHNKEYNGELLALLGRGTN